MPRTTQNRADIDKIKLVRNNTPSLTDFKPIIALTMRYSGCTYSEIGKAFDMSRQAAEQYIKLLEKE